MQLGVTIGGEPFGHLLFQFILSHLGWRYAEVTHGETFLALVSGLKVALWELGGAPEVVRTDNLSTATHELRDSGARTFNESLPGHTGSLRPEGDSHQPTQFARASFDRGNIRALNQSIYGTSPTSTGIAMSFVFAPLRPIQRAGLWQSEV